MTIIDWFIILTCASLPISLYLPSGTPAGSIVKVGNKERANEYLGQYDGAGGLFAILRWLIFRDHKCMKRARWYKKDKGLRQLILAYLRHGLACKVCLSFNTPFVIALWFPISWREYALISLAAAGVAGLIYFILAVKE